MLSKISADRDQRRFNDFSEKPLKEPTLNVEYILDMMRENDTLTIKRSVPPRAYFDLLTMHQKNTNCKVVRVEALGSAIPTMVKFCELAQICDLATITKVQTKPRRMKVGQESDLTL